MPYSKVIQAELGSNGAVDVVVELADLEPGEQALVQTTVVQANAIAAASTLVTGAAPGGPLRVHLSAVSRTGTFTHATPLVTFTQSTLVWSTVLLPLPEGTPPQARWAASDDGWDGDDH